MSPVYQPDPRYWFSDHTDLGCLVRREHAAAMGSGSASAGLRTAGRARPADRPGPGRRLRHRRADPAGRLVRRRCPRRRCLSAGPRAGPRRVSEDELRAAFDDECTILTIQADTFAVNPGLFPATTVQAWLASITRS